MRASSLAVVALAALASTLAPPAFCCNYPVMRHQVVQRQQVVQQKVVQQEVQEVIKVARILVPLVQVTEVRALDLGAFYSAPAPQAAPHDPCAETRARLEKMERLIDRMIEQQRDAPRRMPYDEPRKERP
jgi:hypothetical protein